MLYLLDILNFSLVVWFSFPILYWKWFSFLCGLTSFVGSLLIVNTCFLLALAAVFHMTYLCRSCHVLLSKCYSVNGVLCPRIWNELEKEIAATTVNFTVAHIRYALFIALCCFEIALEQIKGQQHNRQQKSMNTKNVHVCDVEACIRLYVVLVNYIASVWMVYSEWSENWMENTGHCKLNGFHLAVLHRIAVDLGCEQWHSFNLSSRREGIL